MALISLRVSEEEKALISKFAKFNGTGVSTMIKQIVLEAIEDQYDITAADEAHREYIKDKECYTLEEMKKRYDL
ncbi:MAG: type II toxin-antitoxin system RelB family antitoxin [Bacillota bacterium]|jgi:uncharacterized protein (DUF1778 family)